MKLIITFLLLFTFSCELLNPFEPAISIIVEYNHIGKPIIDKEQVKNDLSLRLNALDYKYEIKELSKNEIEILFEKGVDLTLIRRQISRTENFEFWHTMKNSEVGNEIYEIANEVLSKKLFPGYLDSINEAIESNGDENLQFLSENKQLEVFKKTSPLSAHLYPYANAQNQWNISSILGYSNVSDTGIVFDFLSKKYLLDSLSIKDIKFMWEKEPFYATNGQSYYNLHVIKNTKSGKPDLNGIYIKSAKQELDPLSKHPIVSINFTHAGAIIWGDITEKSSINESGIAITMNNKVLSAPIATARIEGGKTQITGDFLKGKDGINQAKIITSLLNLQKSPYRFVVIKEQIIN